MYGEARRRASAARTPKKMKTRVSGVFRAISVQNGGEAAQRRDRRDAHRRDERAEDEREHARRRRAGAGSSGSPRRTSGISDHSVPSGLLPVASGGRGADARAGSARPGASDSISSGRPPAGSTNGSTVAGRRVPGLLVAAVLEGRLEHVVDPVAELGVVQRQADAVRLLGEGLADDLELALVLRRRGRRG